MSRGMQVVPVVLLIAAALVVFSMTTSTAQVAGAPDDTLSQVVEGNYRVLYDLVLPDRTTKSERAELVKRIELHPEYIVIVDQHGVGRVVPVHSLPQLRWEPS